MNREYRGMYFILTLFLCFIVLASHAETAFAATLKLPSALTTIGVEAFYGDNSIDIVQLPDTIERIESKAFANSSLKEINLPDSLEYIAKDAFNNTAPTIVRAEVGTYAYWWAGNYGFLTHVTDVALNRSENTMYVGIKGSYVASVKPETATCRTITWSSSNPSVVSIDSKTGEMTALSKGDATITAKTADGGFTATCITHVVQPATSISLNKNETSIPVGDTETLTLSILPEGGVYNSIEWKSSDETVAKVDSYGNLDPYGKIAAVGLGTATISVTVKTAVDEFTESCKVEVNEIQVENVELSKTEHTLRVGYKDVDGFSYSITPANATDKTVTWKSSDPSVLSVDPSSGKISTLKAGVAIVTATTVNGKTASCTVSVVQLHIQPTYGIMSVGSSVNLQSSVLPATLSDFTTTWTSSDPSVLRIDTSTDTKQSPYIKVTGLKAGTSVVTGTTKLGGATCTYTVTVVSVALNKTSTTINVGNSETLTATVTPGQYAGVANSVTWTSSNNNATVDSNGKVTAKSPGTVTITATSKYGNAKESCTVTVKPAIKVTGGTKRNGIVCRNIYITSDSAWTAETTDSWLTMYTTTDYSKRAKAMSGSAGTDVASYVWLEELPLTVASRTGKITFRNADSSYDLDIVQDRTDAPMTGVSFKPDSGTIAVGQTQTLIPTFEPAYATDRRVTWTSSDSSIATVDASGNVKGITPGTAKITVKTTDGGFTAVYTVTVVKIYITPTYGIMSVGSSVNLQSSVLPATLSDFTTTWTSSDPSVLRIDTSTDTKQSPYIKVTGLKAGTAVVTGKTKLGGATCTYTMTVVSVALNKTSTTINVGNSETLTATVTPAQYVGAGVANGVTWSSSNNNAIVDSNGKVTAKSTGTVTITATSKYGGAKAVCSVKVTAPVTTAPTIIGNPTSLNDTCSLEWTAVPNAVSYTVTATNKGNEWQGIYRNITTTSWSSDWFGDGTYSFTVTAVGDSSVANNSRTSAAKEVTVKANEIKSGPAPTVTVNGTSAKLDWTEVDANATWYEIELWTSANFVNKLNGGSASYMKKIGGYNFDPPILHHATTHTFTGLSTGAYVVSVAGVNAGGHYCFGDSTGFVIGTPNNYPISSAPSLNLSSTGNSINCSWNAINNATQYDVFLVNSSGTTIKSLCLSPNKLNYTFSGLSNGNYWVEVYACNGLITNNDSLRYKASGRQSVSVGISSGGTNNYPTSLYLTQSVSGRCTTASALMLIRAIAYKNGWNGWESITEDTADNVIRIPGEGEKAYWEYSFGGHSIIGQRYSQSGITIAGLKALLDAHPEGIEFYSHQSTSRQHAVFITDYVDNTFYCADPQGGYSGKRIKLEDSLLGYWYGSQSEILNKMTDYWCIISY